MAQFLRRALGGALVVAVATGAPEGISMAPQAFAPDAAALVLGMDDRVVRLDVTTGASRTLRRLPREEGGVSARVRTLRKLSIDLPVAHAWSPDGRTLALGYP